MSYILHGNESYEIDVAFVLKMRDDNFNKKEGYLSLDISNLNDNMEMTESNILYYK